MISQADLGWQSLSPDTATLVQLFGEAGIVVREEFTGESAIAGAVHLIDIENGDWGRAAEVAAAKRVRWSAVWGEHVPPRIDVFALLACRNGHLLLRTHLRETGGSLPSQTPFYPGADRPERTVADMLGVVFTGHPDGRRWLRHQAWTENQFPLRKEFPLAGTPTPATPPDCLYPFREVSGDGVYEIPVGPVHAGIIEPGHFRFQAMGEDILSLEEHLGYVHKGIEKVAEGRDVWGLARLAGRVSGDSTVTHCWAACQASEAALGVGVPKRAAFIRAILAERERIANHLGDIGACCNDVGFAFAHAQCARLRELWQRDNRLLFGHRLLMDVVIPGGVRRDLDRAGIDLLREANTRLSAEVGEILPLLYEYPSLQDRLRTTGELTPKQARALGALGYVARASGECWDLRRDAPYAPYDGMVVTVPHCLEGDASGRVRVRGDEILVSLDLLEELLNKLPPGEIAATLPTTHAECRGIGLVEGWRGETVAYVHLDGAGRVARYFPRDPSWLNWPTLEAMIHGVIVPDFPLCNKSVNGSYSGHDL